jgi:hypothetical protein
MKASLIRTRRPGGQCAEPSLSALARLAKGESLALTELEAGAIICAWPSCPRFASRRVDQLTLRHDRGGW